MPNLFGITIFFSTLCSRNQARDTDDSSLDWSAFIRLHLVHVVQQHYVGGPEVFGRDCAVLQSVCVREGHVLSVPQPNGSSFAQGQILARTLQVQHLRRPEDVREQQCILHYREEKEKKRPQNSFNALCKAVCDIFSVKSNGDFHLSCVFLSLPAALLP